MSDKRWVIQYTIGGPEYEGRYLTLDRDAEGAYTGTSRPVERVEDALRMTQSQADAIVALALGCKAIELPEGVA